MYTSGAIDTMVRKPKFLLVGVLLLNPVPLRAWSPGTAGSQFLKLGVGARPVAMGGAYTAVSDDADALFWNPAGLAQLQGAQGTVMVMTLFRDVTCASGGAVLPTRRWGSFAGGGSFLTATDARRNELGEETGDFTNYDLAVTLGYGFAPLRGLSFGGSLKAIQSKLADHGARTGTIDAGLLFNPVQHVYLGAALKNVGPGTKFIQHRDYPPAEMRGGMAFKIPFLNQRLTLSTDIALPLDVYPYVCLGGEFLFRPPQFVQLGASGIAVRAGYKSGYHLGTWSGFSFGLGIERNLPGLRNAAMVIDVVYISYGYLGDAERVSFSLRF